MTKPEVNLGERITFLFADNPEMNDEMLICRH